MTEDPALLEVFRSEVRPQLEQLRSLTERDPSAWGLAELFRIVHGIKSTAAVVEARGLEEASGAYEELLAELRDGLALTDERVELVLEGYRVLADAFASGRDPEAPEVQAYRERAAATLAVLERDQENAGAADSLTNDQVMLEIFRAEAGAQLEALTFQTERETSRWNLEEIGRGAEKMGRIAAAVGADRLEEAAHALEDLAVGLRRCRRLSDEAIAAVRTGYELVRAAVTSGGAGSVEETKSYAELVVRTLETIAEQAGPEPAEADPEPTDAQGMAEVFRADVRDQLEVLFQRLEREPIEWNMVELFRTTHNIKGAAGVCRADALEEAAHALEDLLAGLRDGLQLTDALVELVHDGSRLVEQAFDSGDDRDIQPIRVYRDQVSEALAEAAGPEPVVEEPPAEADQAPEEPDTPGTAPEPAPVEPTPVATAPSEPVVAPAELPAVAAAPVATIRVSVAKLDELMELASLSMTQLHRLLAQQDESIELLGMLRAMRLAHPKLAATEGFRALLRRGERLSAGLVEASRGSTRLSQRLQDSARSVRLVPIRELVPHLKKVLRDACRTSRRQAKLVVAGAETEIDRTVLERIRDPLVHLLRNAVAHGIEAPERRADMGKAAAGRVILEARPSGAWVEVVVADDGGGVDPTRIRRLAVERGLVSGEAVRAMSDDAVLDVIFAPGFSTLAEATQIAGRGVGLDVVRENLTELGGEVTLKSTLGVGSVFTLRVPLTRLTTTGIVVRLGRERFAIPMMNVERTLMVEPEDIRTAEGRPVVTLDRRHRPVCGLAEVLGLDADDAARRPALLLRAGTRRGILLVDEILGEHEYMMQRLSWNLEHVLGVSGCAVLPDGGLLLHLNPAEVLDGQDQLHATARPGREAEERTRRILVVDDSVTSRTLQRSILKRAGYEVAVAIDGEEGWEKLLETDFDLGVFDVDMPRLSGLDLVKRVREDPERHKLPVILVTSLGSEADRRAGAAVGANAYIVKGKFDQDELLQSVARLL